MKYIAILAIGLVACSEDRFEYKIVCLDGKKVTGDSRSLKNEEHTEGYMLGAMHLCTELDYMAFVGDSVMLELYGKKCLENANALLKMNGVLGEYKIGIHGSGDYTMCQTYADIKYFISKYK